MNLETKRKLEIAEDDKTTKLEDMVKPDQVIPDSIREYPVRIQDSEKMRRLCRNRVKLLEEKLQLIEDTVLTVIEEETIVVTLGRKGYLPEKKKKFTSEIKRQRELRIRLADEKEYQKLKNRKEAYDEARSRWVDHIARLRRELRQLEVDYTSNGGIGVGL